MRQSGMLAAAALFALENNVERLADDHRRARELFTGLMVEGFDVQTPQTNMVYVNMPDAPRWQDQLEEHGVRCFAVAPDGLRLVLHLGVDDEGIARTIRAFAAVKAERGPKAMPIS